MTQAFRGRRPVGSPHLSALSDAELTTYLSSRASAAGARVASIAMVPRPPVELPTARFPGRLWRYSEPVRRSVATRFRKEQMALAAVQAAEMAAGVRYAWVLWVREDAHWFAPLDLSRFARGAVHGKACGGYGGWNDKVWLADRAYFEPLFSMYDELHTAAPSRCQAVARLQGAPADRGDGAVTLDFLAAPSVEQFRERVGLLRRIPYVRHPPEELPTMDSFYALAADGPDEAVSGGAWRLCFPRIYARGCVPAINQSNVDGMHCEGESAARQAGTPSHWQGRASAAVRRGPS